MPDIDLDPKDYRSAPAAGEPVLTPVGPMKLMALVIVIVAGLVIAAVARPIINGAFALFGL